MTKKELIKILTQAYYEKVLYYDVSGYYNLIMINLDLFPRTLNKEAKLIPSTMMLCSSAKYVKSISRSKISLGTGANLI